jgi:outer membrane protein assembly factor BamA
MIRFRNQNVFGLGERLEVLWSGSDKTRLLRGSLEGERIPYTHVGYSLRAERNEDRPRFYEDGELVNRADFRHATLRVALTKTWKRTQSFEAGLAFGRVTTEPRSGLAFEADEDQLGLGFARFVWDKLDDLHLPSRGLRLAITGEKGIPDLGADHDYWRAAFSGRFVQPLGARTALELELFGGISGDDLPVYEQFRLGGPVLAPGRYEEEFWGPQAVAGALTARFEVTRNLKLLARAGTGGVWQKLGEFSTSDLNPGFGAGAIYSTPVGPISGEWGIQTDGTSRFTFTLGYRGP